MKEEQAFGDWLDKNNPRIAKRLMTKQDKKEVKKRKIMKDGEEKEVSATVA